MKPVVKVAPELRVTDPRTPTRELLPAVIDPALLRTTAPVRTRVVAGEAVEIVFVKIKGFGRSVGATEE
jgi:hypothetical protein